jgi:hypothetical protein
VLTRSGEVRVVYVTPRPRDAVHAGKRLARGAAPPSHRVITPVNLPVNHTMRILVVERDVAGE